MSYFTIIKDNVAVDIFQGNVDEYLEEESKLQEGESIEETTEAHYNHLKAEFDKQDAEINTQSLNGVITVSSLPTFDKKYSVLGLLLEKGVKDIGDIENIWQWMVRE